MITTGERLLTTVGASREMELLQQGFSYQAVAKLLGLKVGTLKERNRLAYHVDIYTAFRERIEREGIPNQLRVTDDFGYYFAGLFDGEGTITIMHRARASREGRKAYPEFRLGVSIMLRDDDTDVLQYIHKQVGGVLLKSLSKHRNPALAWKLENIKQLAEVIVPLFDKYRLHSKKGREYQIWRPLVIERYLATLGGETARGGTTTFEDDFIRARDAIQAIRQYTPRLGVEEIPRRLAE